MAGRGGGVERWWWVSSKRKEAWMQVISEVRTCLDVLVVWELGSGEWVGVVSFYHVRVVSGESGTSWRRELNRCLILDGRARSCRFEDPRYSCTLQ